MDQKTFIVENSPAYNSWPMCQVMKDQIICTYTRGKHHNIVEPERAVYARCSSDKGITWSAETLVCNTPDSADSTIGKGLDADGNMLLWVRQGKAPGIFRHVLYRTTDGFNWEYIADAGLPDDTVQITDILHVPGIGLLAFWFAGKYTADARKNRWGKIISTDNGLTWNWEIIEDDLTKTEWVTEPSAVYLGDGKLLIIARTECDQETVVGSQFQITSTDYGKTWKKSRTNIFDVLCSTPGLIFDPASNKIYNYYYYRGKGLLNRRIADADFIFDKPDQWPEPELVTTASTSTYDAGNVNAAVLGEEHCIAYYSGTFPATAILVTICK